MLHDFAFYTIFNHELLLIPSRANSNSPYSLQIHKPEPHILLFKRPLGTDPTTGKVNAEAARAARARYMRDYGISE